MKTGDRVTYRKLAGVAIPPEGTIVEVINTRGVMVQWDRGESYPLCANGERRLELVRELVPIITWR